MDDGQPERTPLDYLIGWTDGDGEKTPLERIALLNELLGTAQELLEDDVRDARRAGASWAEIGDALEVSRQSAHERYRSVAF